MGENTERIHVLFLAGTARWAVRAAFSGAKNESCRLPAIIHGRETIESFLLNRPRAGRQTRWFFLVLIQKGLRHINQIGFAILFYFNDGLLRQ
jgi:hypothetical protein